tara:strand:- start:959 stop:1111 length:153 start_codon:yes stop_codon:yes gene_type:complete
MDIIEKLGRINKLAIEFGYEPNTNNDISNNLAKIYFEVEMSFRKHLVESK